MNRIAKLLLATALLLPTLSLAQSCKPNPDDPRYHFPDTVSPEAANALKLLAARCSVPMSPPKTLADWDQIHAATEKFWMQRTPPGDFPLTRLGQVDVIRVPATRTGKMIPLLIYVHGGAYTLGSARSSLSTVVAMAKETGYEVVSVDYTVAPRGNWQTATRQVIAVYKALIAEGHAPASIGLFGDSAGGGLAAGSVLRMRDEGLPLPGALHLIYPWSDITRNGDSYITLTEDDPLLNYDASLKYSADAYAVPADQKHPYVSPVYGDYSKPFPPTLIQGGTRDIFLSNNVRLYQTIRSGGHEAILDLYEGMPHGFFAFMSMTPEGRLAYKRAAEFWQDHLVGGR